MYFKYSLSIQLLSLLYTFILEHACKHLRDFPLGSVQDRFCLFNWQFEKLLNDLRFQVGHINAWLRMYSVEDYTTTTFSNQTDGSRIKTINGSLGLHKHIIRLKNEIVVRDHILETIQKVFRRICDRTLSEAQISVYRELLPSGIMELLLKFHRERSDLIKEKKAMDQAREEILESQVSLGRAREELKYASCSSALSRTTRDIELE